MEVFGDHYPLRLLRHVKQTVYCSALTNELARLRLHVNTAPITPLKDQQHAELIAHFSLLQTYSSYVEEKVSMLHGYEFRSP